MDRIIKRLSIFDFDSTLVNSPFPEEGIPFWEKTTGQKYPHGKSWWSKPESLDLNIFDIKPIPTVYNQFKREKRIPDTLVFILTSRNEKLRPFVQKVMNEHGIDAELVMEENDGKTKGDKIIDLIPWYPDLEEINVYDDRQKEIKIYESIRNEIPENIVFNVYQINNGNIVLIEHRLTDIIQEEIKNFFYGIY